MKSEPRQFPRITHHNQESDWFDGEWGERQGMVGGDSMLYRDEIDNGLESEFSNSAVLWLQFLAEDVEDVIPCMLKRQVLEVLSSKGRDIFIDALLERLRKSVDEFSFD